MEDEDWQISEVWIGGVVETDLVLRQGQLVSDSNHFEFVVRWLVRVVQWALSFMTRKECSRVSGQLAWVSKSASLGVVNFLWLNIWLGEEASAKTS